MSGEPCTSTYTGASSRNIYRCGDVAGHALKEHETSDGSMWWTDKQANPPEPEPELVKLADGEAQVWLTEEQVLVVIGALGPTGTDERMKALKLKLYGALVGLQ